MLAISMGKIGACEAARNKGWYAEVEGNSYPCEQWRKLPRTLYHVTTAKSSVLKRGIRSRSQLSMGVGVGLGGRAGREISLTDSRGHAGWIKHGILEVIQVAKGKLTLRELVRRAEEGVGTGGKPYIEGSIHPRFGGLWRYKDPAEELPEDLQREIRGQTPVDVPEPKLPEEVPGCEPKGRMGDWGVSQDDQGRLRHRYFWCAASKADQAINAYNFYRHFSRARDSAGGPMDPLFVDLNLAQVAKIEPSEVAILKYRPCPGVVGIRSGDPHEWKLVYNRGVKLDRVDGKRPPFGARRVYRRCPAVR